MRLAAFIAFSLILAIACSDDEPFVFPDFGYDYYPTEIGSYLIYDVDSIVYDDFTIPVSIDTYSFQIREVYESYILDAVGDSIVRIEQYRRDNDTLPWQIDHIATVKITATNVQKTERDLRFVKLPFPPSLGKTWEGHIYLDVFDEPTLEYLDRTKYDWEHRITSENESLSFNNLNFDSCVTVTQIEEENLFELKFSEEIYAKGVGMVYKELMILNTQVPPDGRPVLERAENGFILRYVIKEQG